MKILSLAPEVIKGYRLMNIKKNDTVVVLSGKDKGKQGKVLETMPKSGKVIVEGINVATVHNRPEDPASRAASSARRSPCTPAR